MSTQTITEQNPVTLLADRWNQASRKLTELAEAIPEESFETKPVAGLRTCGEVLRHVAFWNRYVADSLAGRSPNDRDNELSAAEFRGKQSILDELGRSSAEVASLLRKHPDASSAKTAKLMTTFVEHTSEHYGQLVVYVRIIGIVPPASRT